MKKLIFSCKLTSIDEQIKAIELNINHARLPRRKPTHYTLVYWCARKELTAVTVKNYKTAIQKLKIEKQRIIDKLNHVYPPLNPKEF